jgi:hypothetical protein
VIDYLYFGITVAQHHIFYSHTWASALIVEGAKEIPALMIHQACTTSEMALRDAGITVKDLNAVKSHSPFVVNDIYMNFSS